MSEPAIRRAVTFGACGLAVATPLVLGAAGWPRWWIQIAPEQSAMTWLQSVVLTVTAVCAAAAAIGDPVRTRIWLLFAVGFTDLALDERFAVHERLRDQVLAPHHVSLPFLPWVAPGDFLLLLYAVAGLVLLPRFLGLFRPDRGATRLLLLGVALAAVAVGVDSIDPATWTIAQERVQQSAEECFELAADLSLLTAVLFRLVAQLVPAREPVVLQPV